MSDSFQALADRLSVVLAEEREALRRVDAARVLSAASEKERLVQAMVEASPSEADAPRLQQVRDELRRNGVLLAHARDCLRDAIRAAGGEAAAARGTGVHVSARG
jgi:hypothetical protein